MTRDNFRPPPRTNPLATTDDSPPDETVQLAQLINALQRQREQVLELERTNCQVNYLLDQLSRQSNTNTKGETA
jgi:uncharacterized protein YjiS (DUF1127 family)